MDSGSGVTSQRERGITDAGSMAVPAARSSKYNTDFPSGLIGILPTASPVATARPCFTEYAAALPYTEKSPLPC